MTKNGQNSESGGEFVESAVFPPQCSISLDKRGSGDKAYYVWSIKVYDDDLDRAVVLLDKIDKYMCEKYGSG